MGIRELEPMIVPKTHGDLLGNFSRQYKQCITFSFRGNQEILVVFPFTFSAYQLVVTVMMKNWEPLVFAPALAMDRSPVSNKNKNQFGRLWPLDIDFCFVGVKHIRIFSPRSRVVHIALSPLYIREKKTISLPRSINVSLADNGSCIACFVKKHVLKQQILHISG